MYFLGIKESEFSYFPKIALGHGGGGGGTFKNFRGLCYNIQFKPYATSGALCDKKCLKYDGAPRSDPETYKYIQIEAIKYSIQQ